MSRSTPSMVLAALALAAPLAAQEDFRSADLGRPLRVEDAIPTEMRAWEFELGATTGIEEGARDLHGVVEIKAGLLRDVEVGVEIESGLRSPSGGSVGSGVEAAGVHLLYGLRRETPGGPALALRAEAATAGTGAIGRAEPSAGVGAVATRSFGRARLHANGGYTTASGADGGSFWRAGLGGDYPIGLFSRALLADVYAEVPEVGDTRVWVDAGMRIQVSNRSVVDFGLSSRLDEWSDGTANLSFTVGFSRVFGLGGDAPAYPDPSIR